MDASNLIDDFDLSADDLRMRYDEGRQHPTLTRFEWRSAVNQQSTLLGYWDWVHHQIAEYQDDLDSNNPYNQ